MQTGLNLLILRVPDSIYNQLQAMSLRWKADRWTVGDITNQIKQQVKEHLLDCSIMDVYSYVSMALGEEISARTVEYYSAIAEFYPLEIRQEYDDLSFAHFALAMRYGSAWCDILHLALDLLELRGRVPSVAYLEAEYQRNLAGNSIAMPEEPPDMLFQDQIDPSQDLVNDVVAVATYPIVQTVAKALEGLQMALKAMGRVREAERIGEIIAEITQMC
jgi:hypothetical protein